MSRHRQDDLMDLAFDLFLIAPWWLGPIVAVGAFCLFWFSPLIGPASGALQLLHVPAMHMLAWIAGGVLMVAWMAALAGKLFKLSHKKWRK